jgi:hypothetical protein
VRRPLALLPAALVAAGCYAPSLECAVRCDPAAPRCPDGQGCLADGFCHLPGEAATCGALDPDAGGSTACPFNLTAGSHDGTQLADGAVELFSGVVEVIDGSWRSAVVDLGAAGAAPTTLVWQPGAPTGKNLVDGGAAEGGYPEGGFDMTGSLLLYHLDDGGYLDASGSGVDATCEALTCPPPEPGRFRRAAGFTAGDRLDAAGDSLEPSAVTVALWARVDEAPVGGDTTAMLIRKGQGDQEPFTSWSLEADFRSSNQRLTCYVGGVGTGGASLSVTSTSTFELGSWFHVACSYDGSDVRLYVDGQLDRMVSGGRPIDFALPDRGLRLGQWRTGGAPQQRLSGALDEVAVWSRVLSGTEIKALYQRGAQELSFQLRSCTTADCGDDPPFVGPDGTAATAFSEACFTGADGPPSVTLGEADCDGDGVVDGVAAATGRYVQALARFRRPPGVASARLHQLGLCE